MIHWKSLVITLILISICFSFSAPAAEPFQIIVSIPPQAYFVEQIGGELVHVVSMLPEGGFPHTYEPTPQQMKLLSQADLYIRTHVEFEDAWWEKMQAVNPDMHVVDSAKDIPFLHAETEEHHHEEEAAHEDEGHAHHGRDPHIWLSPALVKIQAEHIYQGLVAIDPTHETEYDDRKMTFLDKLETLDQDIRAQLRNLSSRKFLIFHPSWAYFARDYGLEQLPIELEGKEPSAAEMIRIMKTAKNENLNVVFVQPQTNRRSAETIARQLNATVETLDPLAQNWMENMREVADKLAEALQ